MINVCFTPLSEIFKINNDGQVYSGRAIWNNKKNPLLISKHLEICSLSVVY